MNYILNKSIPKQSENYLVDILTARGVSNVESYLKPSSNFLLNPYDLNGMKEGIELLIKHINKKSNIHLIVDCDCDGFTSAAEMYLYLKHMDENVNLTYSLHEGKQHGIELDKNDYDCDLLIIPDAASNQIEEHRFLSEEMGVDILILDHHEAETMSNNAIIINNHLSNYENKNLTGAGVVWKFLSALDEVRGDNYAKELIDLAAVGIIGDMADLRDLETRYITKTGLENIVNVGLKTFVKKQSFSIGDITKLSPYNISFYIAPLINSVIRVGTMEEKEVLFRALVQGDSIEQSTKRGAKPGDTEVCAEKAARIATNCHNRQNKILKNAVDYLEFKIAKEDYNSNRVLIVLLDVEESEKIPSEITGLVAMKLTQLYQKPTLVLRDNGCGSYLGSGRGLNDSLLEDFKRLLNESGYFDFAEGHAQAFGAKISEKNIDKFHEWANEKLKDMDFNAGFYIVDYEFNENEVVNLKALTDDCEILKTMYDKSIAPPKIVVKNLLISPDKIKLMGEKSDSCKIVIEDINFVRFKDMNFINNLSEPVYLTCLGEVSINTWGGRKTYQFIIKDFDIVNATERELYEEKRKF